MPNVDEYFRKMTFNPDLKDSSEVKEWLHSNRFGPYIKGCFRTDSKAEVYNVADPLTGNILTTIHLTTMEDIDDAITNTLEQQQIPLMQQSAKNVFKKLQAIASKVEMHKEMFSKIDSLSRGVLVKDTRNFDLPAMVKYFKYYSYNDYASLYKLNKESVTVGIITRNTPLVALAWLLAPALASQSCVCLVVPPETALSAMVFVKMCFEASDYDKILNVLPGDQSTIDKIVTHSKVSNVVCFGPTEVVRHIKEIRAGTECYYTAFMSGKVPMLVFDSADIDAAVECAVKSAWYNQGAVPWAVKHLIVQNSIFPLFVEKLKQRLESLTFGAPFDLLADVGPIYAQGTQDAIGKVVEKARDAGIEVVQVPVPEKLSPALYFSPTVLIGQDTQALELIDYEDMVPVISVVPFQHAEEAISLVNNSRYGLAASIWLDSLRLSLYVAAKLQVGTVWVNSHGLFDPAVPFGGWKESGTGSLRGLEQNVSKVLNDPNEGSSSLHCSSTVLDKELDDAAIQRYRVDVNEAVQLAAAGQARWATAGPRARWEALQQMAELLQTQGGLDLSIWLDSSAYRRAVEGCSTNCLSVAHKTVTLSKEPLGVVALAVGATYCHKQEDLNTLMPYIVTALSYGNTVVVVLDAASSPHISKVKASMGAIPSGVINFLVGHVPKLMEILAEHHSLNAIWYLGCQPDVAKKIEIFAARDMKKQLTINPNFLSHKELVENSFTQRKAVWLPVGSGIS